MPVLDHTFKALGDPTRRRILALLGPCDLAAGEIARKFDMAFASVSHHLHVLREAGLVRSRRDGQYIIYSLNPAAVQEALLHLADLGGHFTQDQSR